MPTPAGCAVFLGDGKKVISFFIDPSIGASINAVLAGQKPDRPLTHDLFAMSLQSFGAKLQRVVIMRMEGEVYFARLIFQVENEVQQKKIVELDARPSDCIALAVRMEAPMYVLTTLWDELADVSDTLDEMRRAGEDS